MVYFNKPNNKAKRINICFVLICLLGLPFFNGCLDPNKEESEDTSGLNKEEFDQLLNLVSTGWNKNDARSAADCFTEDAVYIEPPDLQLYQGRDELFEFFGGEEGRAEPMKMIWHHLVFDDVRQLGIAEYTFKYRGRSTHGIVIVQIAERKISRWREYQYRTNMEWEDFIGPSSFDFK